VPRSRTRSCAPSGDGRKAIFLGDHAQESKAWITKAAADRGSRLITPQERVYTHVWSPTCICGTTVAADRDRLREGTSGVIAAARSTGTARFDVTIVSADPGLTGEAGPMIHD